METLITDSTTQHGTNYVRDNNYYFDDGSVVLLVENRLFKVSSLKDPTTSILS